MSYKGSIPSLEDPERGIELMSIEQKQGNKKKRRSRLALSESTSLASSAPPKGLALDHLLAPHLTSKPKKETRLILLPTSPQNNSFLRITIPVFGCSPPTKDMETFFA